MVHALSAKDGQGLAGGSDPKHGKWHGPFSDLLEARRAQGALRAQIRKECRCVGAQ